MKIKRILGCLLLIGIICCALVGCGEPSNRINGIYVPKIDNSKDLQEYTVEDNQDNETSYVSDYIHFVREVKGYYQVNIPFTIDSSNGNLRIYDNMYFYEGDYFFLISKDYKYIWATLKDETTEYLSVEREQGEDIQVNVKKSGVYKIVLDITTMVMDFEYKSEITTPFYYPFDDCEIGTLVDGKVKYDALVTNEANTDELVIRNYNATAGKLYTFYEKNTHVSRYKLTVNENSKMYLQKYIQKNSTSDTSLVFNVTGEYNIYVNRKTYELRVEVTDPSKLVYSCMTFYNNEFITLNAKDSNTPYIFEYEYEATHDVGGYGVISDDLPSFYDVAYNKYVFTVEESNLLGCDSKGNYYFKKTGHYKLTINLSTLTIAVEKVVD